MPSLTHWRNAGLLSVSLTCLLCLVGCGSEPDLGPPIRREDAVKIKSGMSLTEIEAILGPSRAATSAERKRLDEIAAKMPTQARGANAGSGTDLGWGNANASLAARFSADQRSFIVSWHIGDGSPAPPVGAPARGPPEASTSHFRDFRKPGNPGAGR